MMRSPVGVCTHSIQLILHVSGYLQTIKNTDLEEIRELGSGTYGSVYHGKWKGSDVAIKRIKASCFAGKPSERKRLVSFHCLCAINLYLILQQIL